eukprot:215144-Chlamydomonas_euryale.AAC.1
MRLPCDVRAAQPQPHLTPTSSRAGVERGTKPPSTRNGNVHQAANWPAACTSVQPPMVAPDCCGGSAACSPHTMYFHPAPLPPHPPGFAVGPPEGQCQPARPPRPRAWEPARPHHCRLPAANALRLSARRCCNASAPACPPPLLTYTHTYTHTHTHKRPPACHPPKPPTSCSLPPSNSRSLLPTCC